MLTLPNIRVSARGQLNTGPIPRKSADLPSGNPVPPVGKPPAAWFAATSRRSATSRQPPAKSPALAEGQRSLHEETRGLRTAVEEARDGDLAERLPGVADLAEVAADHGGGGLPDGGDGPAGAEVGDLLRIEAVIHLTPAEDRDVGERHGDNLTLSVSFRPRKSNGSRCGDKEAAGEGGRGAGLLVADRLLMINRPLRQGC